MGKIIMDLTKERNLQRSDYMIQTKIDPWQMQQGKAAMIKYVKEAILQLHCDYLDALLIHWPVPAYFRETWDTLVELKKTGLVKQIGVCNVRLRHLKLFQTLEQPPQIVQVERNPLRTCDEEINYCKEHEIVFQAYSPLCKMNAKIQNSSIIKDIATRHARNIGQIVMKWQIVTGAVPVFTTTKSNRINEYTTLSDFQLSRNEINAISSLNENFKMYLESRMCPGF